MENSTALAIIKTERDKGSLVLVEERDLVTTSKFRVIVQAIPTARSDFHDRAINGGYVPKKHHVDAIGRYAGVDFGGPCAENCSTKKTEKYVWTAQAQGRKRGPDGAWEYSAIEFYEFDASIMAAKDAGADTGQKYEKQLREYANHGMARATTGARLRVIRQLLHMPTAFTDTDFNRSIVVSRVVVDVDALLDDPTTRQAAISMAIGSTAEVFGPSPEQAQIEAPVEVQTSDEPEALDITGAVEVAVDDGFGDDTVPTEAETLDHELEEWLLDDVVGATAVRADQIRAALKAESLEAKKAMIDRCRAYKAKAAV